MVLEPQMLAEMNSKYEEMRFNQVNKLNYRLQAAPIQRDLGGGGGRLPRSNSPHLRGKPSEFERVGKEDLKKKFL